MQPEKDMFGKRVPTAQPIKMSREWAMPFANTFDCPPINRLIKKYLTTGSIVVDPFARNQTFATYTNDINPKTKAMYHLDASDFLKTLYDQGIRADLVLFDPPYSPRQCSENYKAAGIKVTANDTRNASLYKRVRNGIHKIVKDNGIVISFGWNSCGMGKKKNYIMEELLLVCHGGAHYDTICMVERKIE